MTTKPTPNNSGYFIKLRIQELAAERRANAAIQQAIESTTIALYKPGVELDELLIRLMKRD